MSRQWRTVYHSGNKRVLVKGHGRRPPRKPEAPPPPTPPDTFLGLDACIWYMILAIVAIIIAIPVVCFLLSVLGKLMPFLVLGFIIWGLSVFSR